MLSIADFLYRTTGRNIFKLEDVASGSPVQEVSNTQHW